MKSTTPPHKVWSAAASQHISSTFPFPSQRTMWRRQLPFCLLFSPQGSPHVRAILRIFNSHVPQKQYHKESVKKAMPQRDDLLYYFDNINDVPLQPRIFIDLQDHPKALVAMASAPSSVLGAFWGSFRGSNLKYFKWISIIPHFGCAWWTYFPFIPTPKCLTSKRWSSK